MSKLTAAGSPASEMRYSGLATRPTCTWYVCSRVSFDLSQLTREQTYQVHVGRVASPEYRISLAGEPAAVSFDIEYHAPAYARLPVQRGAATRGDLSALRGSRALVEALFDRDLESL